MGSDGDPAPQLSERVERILAVLHSIGPGEVVTYGDIADDAGYPRQSRFVGRVLATTDTEVPWWRVVNAAGRLVPGNEREQSAFPEYDRPGRAAAVDPEKDEAFLRQVRERAEAQRKAYEERRKREQGDSAGG